MGWVVYTEDSAPTVPKGSIALSEDDSPPAGFEFLFKFKKVLGRYNGSSCSADGYVGSEGPYDEISKIYCVYAPKGMK